MKKQEALEVLSQVCGIYKGTLEEHKTLQAALEAVSKLEESQLVEPQAIDERS